LNENESDEEKKKTEEIIDATDDCNENGDLRKDETISSPTSNVNETLTNLSKSETKADIENPTLEADKIKEQERIDKVIIHSLISLLMKVNFLMCIILYL
jgi:hypothetical protein